MKGVYRIDIQEGTMAEFIYQMHQARKAHGDKVILDDVTLSFYPGAKIGVWALTAWVSRPC